MKLKIIQLYVFLVVFSINVNANDTIRFTWQADTSSKNFIIVATINEQFTINWGDDSSTVETGTSYTQTMCYEYANANYYTVTISANTINCRFTQFESQANQLSSLDVSNSTDLKVLHCNNNLLNSLNVSKNTALTGLYCYYNQLNSLDVSKNKALTTLWCYLNPLNNLDISKNPYLVTLWCSENQLKNLDVSKNTALSDLRCASNQISSLDVGNNTDLINLWCSENQLESLDVSNNTDLINLWCSNNMLNSLKIGNNQVLKHLYCYNNRLQFSDLFTASEIIFIQDNKWIGTQILPPQTVKIGDTLFSEQSIFNDIYTDYYVVTFFGSPVSASDYTIIDGMIIFNNTGDYVVTMTNAAIVSYTDFPAQVIAEITVSDVGIKQLTMDNGQLTVYPNPTTDKLTINNGQLTIKNIELFDIVGKKQLSIINCPLLIEVDISHLSTGLYFLKVDEKTVKIVKK